jgi:hypothetical protein
MCATQSLISSAGSSRYLRPETTPGRLTGSFMAVDTNVSFREMLRTAAMRCHLALAHISCSSAQSQRSDACVARPRTPGDFNERRHDSGEGD